MNLEIILAIAWTSLCVGERLKRSTVLTDESKRILEHFDFSNFDKQEALNYIDRQRYENQIRGKRSHTNLKGRNTDGNKETYPDKTLEKIESKEIEDDSDLGCKTIKKSNKKRQPNILKTTVSSNNSYKKTLDVDQLRNKRHRQHKKKRKSKKNLNSEQREHDNDYDEDKEERRLWKRKRRKRRRRYWDHWSEWSPCSVTCGKGRKIRWRKCIAKNCTTGELEMGEKTCQLPACSLLNKLLGI